MLAKLVLAALFTGFCVAVALIRRADQAKLNEALDASRHLRTREDAMRQTLMRRTKEIQDMRNQPTLLVKQEVPPRANTRYPLPGPVEESTLEVRYVDEEGAQ